MGTGSIRVLFRQPELAEHFQVNAIPDVRVFRDGKYVDGFRGYQEAERILAVVR